MSVLQYHFSVRYIFDCLNRSRRYLLHFYRIICTINGDNGWHAVPEEIWQSLRFVVEMEEW